MAQADSKTLRVAVCGSGNRSRTVWQRHLQESANFELVGVQDPSEESLSRAVEAGAVTPKQTFSELHTMLAETHPDALVACPINAAHASAAEVGLEAGCHILVEKPFTTDLIDALRLNALAEERGLKVGVVQNWRTKDVGRELQRAVSSGVIGQVSHIFFRYLRDRELPHLPDYLFSEPHPLLYAMSIHHFDLFRFVLGQEIATVEGRSMRPSWSRYEHDSVMQLWLETDVGVAISYAGTFSSRGAHLPLESLQVEGELGTLVNESQYLEPPLLLSKRGEQEMIDLTDKVSMRDQESQYEVGDTAILTNFHAAVTANEPLIASASDNIGTLAVMDATRMALDEGRCVVVNEHIAEVSAQVGGAI